MTVHPVPFLAKPAVGILLEAIVEIVHDVEIKAAVAIVVEKTRARAPLNGWSCDASRAGDVAKGAVAVVVEEDVRSERGYVEIEVSVVVVVADGDAGLVRLRIRSRVGGNSRARRYIGE